MKKLLVLLIVLLFLTACGNDGSKNTEEKEQSPESNQQEENNQKEIASGEEQKEQVNREDSTKVATNKGNLLEEFVKHFEKQGFEIGEKAMKAAELVGATNGFGIELNGEEIELYVYESNSQDLEVIKTNREYEMDGFPPFPAIANENIVMMAHDEHPEKERVIETFNNFE